MAETQSSPAKLLVLTIVSVRPYLYEVPHILALEEKTPFKFRFRTHWIPENYQGILSEWAEKGVPVDQRCVIMFRHQETGRFLPVRWCILQEVSIIGEVFYLRVSLGALPDIEFGKDARQVQWGSIQETHVKALGNGFSNDPGQPLRKLVFTTGLDDYVAAFHNTSYKGASKDKPFSNWDSLFLQYSELPEFRGIDFFKIIGLFVVNAKGTSRSVEISKVGVYRVLVSQRYALRIYQRRAELRVGENKIIDTDAAKSPTVYPVKLHVDTEAIRTLDGDQPVLGRYDVLEFLFRPTDGGAGQVTFLIVQLIWENAAHPDALKKFRLPLDIIPRRRDFILTAAFSGVLVSLFFRKPLAETVGLQDQLVLNIQTFSLFLLGVAVPSVQRVVQSTFSKFYGF